MYPMIMVTLGRNQIQGFHLVILQVINYFVWDLIFITWINPQEGIKAQIKAIAGIRSPNLHSGALNLELFIGMHNQAISI